VLSYYLPQSSHLNWITDSGSGTMSLNIAHLTWLNSGIEIGFTLDSGLSVKTGRHQGTVPAIIVYCAAKNGCINPITISYSFRQGFEYDDAASFTSNETICSCITEIAPSLWG
jgi:hypothetical protein